MQHRVPTPVLRLREREARVIEPRLVKVIDAAIRPRGPDHLRHGIGEEAVALRAFAHSGGDLCLLQLLLDPASLAEVGGDQTDRRRGLSGERTQRQLQRHRARVASTEGDLPGAAAGATGLQQSGKPRALRRRDKGVESAADDSLQRRLQQIGKPAIAIENRAVG